MSWNGGMEVRWWRLQGKIEGDDRWEEIITVPRDGFETAFALPRPGDDESYSEYNIAALDENGEVLRLSNPFELTRGSPFALWKIVSIAFVAVTACYILTTTLKDRGVRMPDVILALTTIKRKGYMKLEADSEP